MHIHILGICGTFMAGVARIASQLGHKVTGSDQNIYPPMSEQLKQQGISLLPGYTRHHLKPMPDQIIVGNVISRGNPLLEYILNKQLPFFSGPEWLYQNVLKNRHVLAVAGTHGKTTTTSILAWILECANFNPGFLIGGVAENFLHSARYTDSNYFVIEADEYDTAFSDKQAKFLHYHPRTLIINNIEYDHADIFHDIADIRRQFHYLLRLLPAQATIIYQQHDNEIKKVLAAGCWSEKIGFAENGLDWSMRKLSQDYSCFAVLHTGEQLGEVNWSLIGEHNANNALAAIIAAEKIGIAVPQSCQALENFKPVKKRLECILNNGKIYLYDDFAHHPTAIAKTLQALRQHVGKARIITIMEPGSNTMRMGIHAKKLAQAFMESDQVLIFQDDNITWDIAENMIKLGNRCHVFNTIAEIVTMITNIHQKGDHIIMMSNSSFGNLKKQLIEVLS